MCRNHALPPCNTTAAKKKNKLDHAIFFSPTFVRANLMDLGLLCFLLALSIQATFPTKPCHQQEPCPGSRASSVTSTTPASTAKRQEREPAKWATLTTPCRLHYWVEPTKWSWSLVNITGFSFSPTASDCHVSSLMRRQFCPTVETGASPVCRKWWGVSRGSPKDLEPGQVPCLDLLLDTPDHCLAQWHWHTVLLPLKPLCGNSQRNDHW